MVRVTRRMRGYYRDEAWSRHGDRLWTREGHNLIVNEFGVLLAALCSGQGGYAGITWWAVGQGESSWDTSGTPEPSVTQTTLIDEIARVQPTLTYLDANGNPTTTVTNVVQATAVFGLGVANGSLREQGLFGGTATSAANTGQMIDAVNNAIISKPSGSGDFVLTRVISLTL